MSHRIKKRPVVPPGGLKALETMPLAAEQQAFFDRITASMSGPQFWCARKSSEARDVMALDQITARMHVQYFDVRQDIKLVIRLETPVACMPAGQQEIVIREEAILGISYLPEDLRQPQPGYKFVQILEPFDVWHPNVGMQPAPFGQPLCLGPRLPAGIRLKELILLSYGALTMQTVQMDEYDAAGVMNWPAAGYWQQNVHPIPLSRASFLDTVDLDQKEHAHGDNVEGK